MMKDCTKEFPIAQQNTAIAQALLVLFSYFDSRASINDAVPSIVEKAFEQIVKYYTPRLVDCVKLQPSDFMRRVIDPEDLYTHAWAAIWVRGQSIKCRSLAGVYAWLKRVIHNRRIQLIEKYADKLQITDSFDERHDDSLGNYKENVMQNLALVKEDCMVVDAIDQFDLLAEFFEKALTLLPDRQQTIIGLSNKKYSPVEIMQLMGFTSIDAMKSFKRRAFRALRKPLYSLLKSALRDRFFELQKKTIIEEWLEKHCKHFAKEKKHTYSVFST